MKWLITRMFGSLTKWARRYFLPGEINLQIGRFLNEMINNEFLLSSVIKRYFNGQYYSVIMYYDRTQFLPLDAGEDHLFKKMGFSGAGLLAISRNMSGQG